MDIRTHRLTAGSSGTVGTMGGLRLAPNEAQDAFVGEPSVARERVKVLFALVLYVGFAALDPWMVPSRWTAIWLMRVVVVALLAGVVLAMQYERRPGRIQALLALAVLAMGAGFIGMMIVSRLAGGFDYSVALVLIVLFAHALLRLRFMFATLSCWVLTLGYLAAVIRLDETPAFASSSLFLLVANVIGMFASRARERSERSERSLQLLVDSMNEGLMTVDREGFITWVNRGICEMFGYQREELIGRHSTTFMNEQNRKLFAQEFERRKLGGNERYEIELVRKDGTPLNVLIAPQPLFQGSHVFSGSVAVLNDITALKRVERALEKSECHFRELVDYASSIILRWDTQGVIRFINPFGLRFLGYSAEEMLGRNVVGTIVPETDSSGEDLVEMIHDITLHPERHLYNENEIQDRAGHRYWVVWTNRALTDTTGKVTELLSIGTDITELKRAREALARQRDDLAELNEFIRRIFGRYVSDAVVRTLLESPEGLRVGGTKSQVTILVADIRGFSSICEERSPEQVVALINGYLEGMTTIIEQYDGTIDEFIGDGILVIFGAPVPADDHAERGVACALAMQLGMEAVNARNRGAGLPAVEMGIGIDTGEAVVGNLGSAKRAKYGVVGNVVNMASRIEAYSIGGQILVSEHTRRALGESLTVGRRFQVAPKGAKEPIDVYEAQAIAGRYELALSLAGQRGVLRLLDLPCRYMVLEEKFVARTVFAGRLVALSLTEAELMCEVPIPLLTNVKLNLTDGARAREADVYAKVVELLEPSGLRVRLRFTSVPPLARRLVEALVANGPRDQAPDQQGRRAQQHYAQPAVPSGQLWSGPRRATALTNTPQSPPC